MNHSKEDTHQSSHVYDSYQYEEEYEQTTATEQNIPYNNKASNNLWQF